MSTEFEMLLEGLDQGRKAMPLVAVNDGRYPGAEIPGPSRFSKCRLPDESRAGWLLYAGYAMQSHILAQDLITPEATYWHAIYHRLEPDPWNSKYWFRQFGTHPIEGNLLAQSREVGWNPGRNWDHAKFVDFIGEAIASNRQERISLAASVQFVEWRLLFEFCVKDLLQ